MRMMRLCGSVQEHIRCSLELSCLEQCLDRPQRQAMAQAAISELTGPLTSPAQAPSPVTRSPRAAQGTRSRLKDVTQLCQQAFELCMRAGRSRHCHWIAPAFWSLYWLCILHLAAACSDH